MTIDVPIGFFPSFGNGIGGAGVGLLYGRTSLSCCTSIDRQCAT